MSTINVKCVDHTLTTTNTPILSSGSQNVDLIEFDFCPLWNGFTKEALFWKANKPNVVYRMIFETGSNSVKVPATVIDEKGKFIFAVRGVKDDDVRTSNVVTYDVVEGTITEGVDPEVNPDAYQQILEEFQKIRLTFGEQIREQNKGFALEFWVGTQAEYDALESPATNTFYIITDEPGANELLERIVSLENENTVIEEKFTNTELEATFNNFRLFYSDFPLTVRKYGNVVKLSGTLKIVDDSVIITADTSARVTRLPEKYCPDQQNVQTICQAYTTHTFLLTIETNGRVSVGKFEKGGEYTTPNTDSALYLDATWITKN